MDGPRLKAWQAFELGEPEAVLRLGEKPSLDPAPDEVILDVAACGANFSDILLCRGEYQEKPPLPFTPGTEVVGTVVAAGADAELTVGARIVGRATLPDGGFAEQARVLARRALPVPDTVDDATAAALHVTYQTAWFGLHERAALQPGETLLVHAAAGGTGSAAVQIGLAAGARVITTAGGAAKVEQCRMLGADLALDSRVDDIRHAVLDATEGEGADVVFDPVGGDLFDISRRCVAFEGRIVVVGFASGRAAEAPTNHVMVKNYSVVGLHWPGYEARRPDLVRRAHSAILDLHAAGHVRPLLAPLRSLDDVPDALTDLAAGRTTGKVVIVR
jgi:NADPH2:quinone reductase